MHKNMKGDAVDIEWSGPKKIGINFAKFTQN